MSDISATSGQPPSHTPEIGTQSGLTQLYNQPVIKVERVERPITSSDGKKIPFIGHQGVSVYRITTESGQQHLVHKGPNFGKYSDRQWFSVVLTCPVLSRLLKHEVFKVILLVTL